jgi:CHASE2 domain-containing sensor protein
VSTFIDYLWSRQPGKRISVGFQSVKSAVEKLAPLLVLAVAMIGGVMLESEGVKEQLPFIVTAQLYFHRFLSALAPGMKSVRAVTVVGLDDDAFWNEPVNGSQPTNRRYLADLASTAASGDPLLIAIDFRMLRPNALPGDLPSLIPDDKYLLEMIRTINKNGTPVVLGAFMEHGRELPNIFRDDELPALTTLGLINLPKDTRQVPLQATPISSDTRQPTILNSFALAIVDANEKASSVSPRTIEDPTIVRSIKQNKFVYGGFLAPSAFRFVTSGELYKKSPKAISLCHHRIVIIGGVWHTYAKNTGPLIEETQTSVGSIPRVYLHANYVEDLLAGRYQSQVPRWFALLIELVAGLCMYGAYHVLRGTRLALCLVTLIVIVFLIAYVIFADFGFYLDFVPLLFIILIHIFYEHRQRVELGLSRL